MIRPTIAVLFGLAIGNVAIAADDAAPAAAAAAPQPDTTTTSPPGAAVAAEAACVKDLDVAIGNVVAARNRLKETASSTRVPADGKSPTDKLMSLDESMNVLSVLTVANAQRVTPRQDQMVSSAVATAATAVQTGANQMARLHALWKKLGRPETVTAEFLDARRRIADCADVVFAQASDNEKVTTTMANDPQDRKTAETALAHARRDYVYIAHEQNYDEAQLSLFTGPTLSLNGDDKFKTGFEVSALFDGGAGSAFGIGRLFSDFNYQTKGSVTVMAEDDGSVSQPGANQLFREDKGYLKFNVGASTGFGQSGRYSAFMSTGLSTIPGVGGDFPQALRPRVALGMLARSFVSEGMYTRLSVSVAHDEYWTTATGNPTDGVRIINSYERGVVEALVLVPQLSTSGVTLAGRIGLDTPLDGKGPSEVRLSVLASVSFGDFLKKIISLPAAP